MEVLVPGHVYDLWQLGTDEPQRLTFVRRSGGAVIYQEEWPGLQTQEVLRALIDRTLYLDAILPCKESEDAVWYLRMALFSYEARAHRRKQESLNRKRPEHNDRVSPKAWRMNPFDDVPFNEHEIEKRPIGTDGHILIEDKHNEE